MYMLQKQFMLVLRDMYHEIHSEGTCVLLEIPSRHKLVQYFQTLQRNEDIYLTNRFHVAVRLFSNRSQMTSKCGKNKKVAHEAIAECVTDVLTTF